MAIILKRAERITPTFEIAQRALDDAKAARDRECVKIGPICRMREDAVADRQRKLDEVKAEVRAAADPQAEALHITPEISVGILGQRSGHDEHHAAQHAHDGHQPPGKFGVAGFCQQPVGGQAANHVADDTCPKR